MIGSFDAVTIVRDFNQSGAVFFQTNINACSSRVDRVFYELLG
jgi:hypothetical protein